MDIYIRIKRKHLYSLITILAVAFGVFFVLGAGYSGFSNPVAGTYHYLQDIVKNDAKVSVDINNNGFIDSADSCNNGEDACVMGMVNFTPQDIGSPAVGQMWIKP